MAYIDIDNIEKEYLLGDTIFHAINGIHLKIEQGECVIIVGPSGAGKTTLLNMIGGLDKPTSGKIAVNNTIITNFSPFALNIYRKFAIGVVFQFFNLLSRFNALENVEYAIQLTGVRTENGNASFKGKDIRQKATDYLAAVGLKDRMKHFPAQLSGGEQQRVAIARALAKEPDIILADEPTGNLDYNVGRNVLKVMDDMVTKSIKKRTLIIVTHNEAICPMGDHIIRLSSGEIAEDYKQERISAEKISW